MCNGIAFSGAVWYNGKGNVNTLVDLRITSLPNRSADNKPMGV